MACARLAGRARTKRAAHDAGIAHRSRRRLPRKSETRRPRKECSGSPLLSRPNSRDRLPRPHRPPCRGYHYAACGAQDRGAGALHTERSPAQGGAERYLFGTTEGRPHHYPCRHSLMIIHSTTPQAAMLVMSASRSQFGSGRRSFYLPLIRSSSISRNGKNEVVIDSVTRNYVPARE